MRVSMDENDENEKTSTKPSTKYDHFMRVCTNKNEEGGEDLD